MKEMVLYMDAKDEGREEERKNTEAERKRADEAEARADEEKERADRAEIAARDAKEELEKYKAKFGSLA